MSTVNVGLINEIVQRKDATAPKAEPVPEAPTEAKNWTLPKGSDGIKYEHFSTVFGWEPEGVVGDFPVAVFEKESWPEELRLHVPTEFDYEPPRSSIELLVAALMQGDKSLISGPTGSGKSSMVKWIASKLHIPFQRVACSGDMESSAIFGMPSITEGTMSWNHGPAGELGLGGGILLVDEWETAPPEVTMALQYILEDDGKIFLRDMPGTSNEKTIDPHQWFRLVMTGNTLGQGDTTGAHAGTQVQNSATLDRFQTVIHHGYLSEDHEKALIKKHVPSIDDAVVDRMVKVAHHVRGAYAKDSISLTMSPRTLVNWARKVEFWGDELRALKVAFFDKLEQDDASEVDEYVYRVYARRVRG